MTATGSKSRQRKIGTASPEGRGLGHWWRDENGAVLVSALLVVLLVTLLGTVAITESVAGSHSAAVVRKHMQVLAAANAGASAAVASVENQAANVTSQTQALTCTSPVSNQYLMSTSPSGAANAASAETYTVYYDVFVNSQPSQAELDDIQASPSASMSGFSNFSSGGACSSSGTGTQITPPSGAAQWYLVVASSGSTASNVYGASSGTAKTSVVDLQMNWSAKSTTTTSTTTTTTPSSTTSTTAPTTTTTTAVTTGQLSSFTDALFAANTLSPGSSFCDFNRNGTNPCPGVGESYTNSQLNCTNSNNYMGDVYASDNTDADAVIGGNCYIEGNLYTPGNIDITSGGTTDMTCPAGGGNGPPWWDICGNVYATGSSGVTIGAGFTVQGSIYSNGPVNISGGSKKQASVGGNIYSEGTVTVASGTSVAGSIYQDCTASVCLEGGTWVTDPGAFPIILPPTQSFPPYTYSANAVAWQNAGFNVLVNNLNQSCDPTNGAMPAADYSAIESMTGPSVLITNCAFVWDASENPEAGQTFALNHSLAIFASGGFNFDGTTKGTEVQGSGSPDLYAMVPWGGSPTPPPNGETACPSSLGSSSNPNGDVWDSATIAGANVFLYTPDNVCTSGNMSLTGQIYAGNDLTGTGTFTPNPGLALPYGIISGSTTTSTTVGSTTTTTTGSTTSTTQPTTTTTQPTTTSTTTASGNWTVTVLSVQ